MRGYEWIPVIYRGAVTRIFAASYMRQLVQEARSDIVERQSLLDQKRRELHSLGLSRGEYQACVRACEEKAADMRLLEASVTALEKWLVGGNRCHLESAMDTYDRFDDVWRKRLRALTGLVSGVCLSLYGI